jgi:uncharacterized protein (TIGR02145 family)
MKIRFQLGDRGSWECTIENLKPGMRYFVMAYAINSAGIGRGNQTSFLTTGLIAFNSNLTYGSVSDVEGNEDKTIQIGIQIWMADNLKTKCYNDRYVIFQINDTNEWSTLTIPAHCYYENHDSVYKGTFGALYYFQAVNPGKLCPLGWHVPGSYEWTTHEDYPGGSDIAGGKLIETGTINWLTQNTGATNESGINALPIGVRGSDGIFINQEFL